MAVAGTTTSSKRPSVPRQYGPTQVERWLFGLWTALVFAFLYVPILLLIVFSFNSSRLNIRWEGFSLKWYVALLENRTLLTAFQNSLIVAAVTTILATVLGTVGAWPTISARCDRRRLRFMRSRQAKSWMTKEN